MTLLKMLLMKVYPACAGIHPGGAIAPRSGMGLPRMRGDPPSPYITTYDWVESTPHARGSTPYLQFWSSKSIVYPACAGIHRKAPALTRVPGRLPRMRGDPPLRDRGRNTNNQSTPHARGSTHCCLTFHTRHDVYPACAGIHPAEGVRQSALACLPRMRGDPPVSDREYSSVLPSTPHARGSTLPLVYRDRLTSVYPACAGIHPVDSSLYLSLTSLPRMRGDPPKDR